MKERKSMEELQRLRRDAEARLKEVKHDIDHLDYMIYDQGVYLRYHEQLISINKGNDMCLYDFFQLVFKSLPKKFKKIPHIRDRIHSTFQVEYNDFFRIGNYIFKLSTSSEVFNIDIFIEAEITVGFLQIKGIVQNTFQASLKEDVKGFYKKLRKNIDKYVEDHPEYFI